MKEIGNWYYQVWLHRGHDNVVTAVDTYKTEWQAMKSADAQNAATRHDNRPDLPLKKFFFVRPIAKEDLPYGGSKYDSYLSNDKREFMKHYGGELFPFAQNMVVSMLKSLNEMDTATSVKLDDHGGWHVGYEESYSFMCYIVCTAIFSGIERVLLEVSLRYGAAGNECATFVGEFEDKEELKDWLADTEKAAKICEEKLIEIRCDSFYEYFFK